jgi:hypothetical protein
MKTLPTWGQGSRFSYAGSVRTGTTISYGSGYLVFVTPEVSSSLRDHFQGMTVDAGTSRTYPPVESSEGRLAMVNGKLYHGEKTPKSSQGGAQWKFMRDWIFMQQIRT